MKGQAYRLPFLVLRSEALLRRVALDLRIKSG